MAAIEALRRKSALKQGPATGPAVGDTTVAAPKPTLTTHNAKSIRAVRVAVRNMEQFVSNKTDGSMSSGWLGDIESLRNHLSNPLPTRTVVVVGHAGHGKTTLLNSLLHCPILTTGATGRACTSAVVELHYDDIPNYRAKVDFLSRSAWTLLLSPLVEDVLNTCQRLPSSTDAATTSAMDDSAAVLVQLFPHLSGLEVYGNVSLEILANHSSVEQLIGFSREFSVDSPQDMEEKLRGFLSSRQGVHQQRMWYFVDSAKIFGRFGMLATGTVLIDLPGYGDSNLIRSQKAADYMERADTIILVSDIRRVADDANTHQYLKKSIKRFVGFDGRTVADDALMMVVTGSDNQIADSEYEFQNDEECKVVADFNSRISHIGGVIQEGNGFCLQFANDPDSKDVLEEARKEIAQHVKDQSDLVRDKLCYLALQRVEQIKKQVQDLYENTWCEINKGNPIPSNPISVHVVGSVDYRRLRSRDPMQAGPMVFKDINHTGIPGLQQHISNVALRDRSSKLVLTLTSFDSLASELCQHYQAHQTSKFDSYVAKAKDELESLQYQNSKTREKNVSLINDTIEVMVSTISDVADKSAGESHVLMRKFGVETHANTYRAVMRRHGELRDIDLNDLLASDLTAQEVLTQWNMSLNRTLPSQMAKLSKDLRKEIEDALEKMVTQAEEILTLPEASTEPPSAKRRKIDIANNSQIRNARRSVKYEAELDHAYRKAEASVRRVQRSYGGTFKHLVQKELDPHYDTMGLEKGKGMVTRIKAYIEEHLETNSGEMFSAVVERVREPLSGVQGAVDSAYIEALEKIYRVIRNTMLVEHRSIEDAERRLIETFLASLNKYREYASRFADRLQADAEEAGRAIAASSAHGLAQ